MKTRIAVILSGCGVFDGTEIHEATLTLLAIRKNNCDYEIFAPDMLQADVVNHFTGKPEGETRNVLHESARIARGKIEALDKLNPQNFDAVVMPGGFGAAKNLCNIALKGADYAVIPQLSDVLKGFNKLGKPIGAMCVAPVIIAKVFDGSNVTVGQKCSESDVIEKIGAKHTITTHAEVVVDAKLKLATTPCYMLDADIVQIAEGTENLIKELLKLM